MRLLRKLALSSLICNTSPIQYLHQLGLLDALAELSSQVIVPPAVVNELEVGLQHNVDLPIIKDLTWFSIQSPISTIATPLIPDLGSGETEVLMLGLELKDVILVLDDSLARKTAQLLQLKFTGTLGVLLDAKKANLISNITPHLNRLQTLGFRLAPHTYQMILKLAEE